MVHYIIQIVAFQLFFLLIYDVFLKKETFFNWNRVYLLATSLLSVVLPFIQIDNFKTIVPQEYVIALPEIVIGESSLNSNNLISLSPVIINSDATVSYWGIVFYIGVTIALFIFLYKLIRILVLIFKNPKTYQKDITLIKLIKSNAAFSFFRYVFLGDFIKREEREAILKHETVHVKHIHSLDLLYFEILRVVFWFNPLVYMYQNRINTLHEFIADSEAVKHQDKSQYYQNLLAQVFETKNISFINTFFKQSLIKKRIIMLTKSKSKQIHLIKYALLIPLVLGMLVYTSSNAQGKDTNASNSSESFSNDDELIGELTDELNELIESGEGHQTISKIFYANSTNYILSKEEYYRTRIYFQCLTKNYDGAKLNNNQITYNEYLEWKKTEEAKEVWGSSNPELFLRFGINDLENISSKENIKIKNKKEFLTKHLFFTKLTFVGSKGGTSVFRDSKEFSSANTIDESKDELSNKVVIDVPFSVVEEVPIFPGCEDLISNKERRDCMSEKISKFVQEKFNTGIADSLGLTGRQRINVIFKIGELGSIITDEIRVRAPHIDLEEEAIRVISALPKMIPGKQKGKLVNVPYSLPIIFEVQD